MVKNIFHNKLLILAIFIVLFNSSLITQKNITAAINTQEDLHINYVTSNAISITNNSAFDLYGFPGNGSESSPFIIENLKIITDFDIGIYICYTSVHFIIRNCLIDAYEYGILIHTIAPGTAKIENNICNNILGGTGIITVYANNITISTNICENNFAGINIQSCENLNLSSNKCGFNTEPISIYSCPNSYIFNNSVDYGSDYGIYLYNSHHTLIFNNTISKIGSNSYYQDFGLSVIYCSDLLIKYNTMIETGRGIYLYVVSETLVTENIMLRCSSYGISASWSDFDFPSANNTFHHNYFIENSWYNTHWTHYYSQAYDRGINSTWYDINTNIGNYYSNYTGEGVYFIAEEQGGSLYYDPYPIQFTDSDLDGLDDIKEQYIYHTNVYDNDTDGDTLLDGEEVYVYFTNPLSVDSDFDGLTDAEEIQIYHTNPNTKDSDLDGLSDGAEINIYGTNPKKSDSDGDTMPDGWEALNGLNPLVDDAEEDPDDDGLLNFEEFEEFTKPLNADSDNDLLSDGDEVKVCFTSPLNNDTDADGVMDGVEYHTYHCDPTLKDTDGDTLWDGKEIYVYFTDPTNPDTDEDSMPDGWETKYNFNPLDPSDKNDDPDNDGLTNKDEYKYGTIPTKWDTDEDDFSDGHDVRAGTDPLLITDHPMYKEEIIRISVGISIGVVGVVGLVFYILVKKNVIRLKKK